MKTYNDFLSEIEKLKNEPFSPKRGLMASLLKNRLNRLTLSIKYQKIKLVYNIKIDYLEADDFLYGFFGNNDLRDSGKKLKELRKKLKEAIKGNK